MPVYGAWMNFRDDKGYCMRTTVQLSQASLAAALLAGLLVKSSTAGVSNANLESAGGFMADHPQPLSYGSSDLYSSISDRAVIFFQDNNGMTLRYTIPAPKSTLFLADGETVNIASGAGHTLVLVLIAQGFCTRSGNVAVAAVGGRRERKRMRRSINSTTLGPSLLLPS
jgi:hypothetical protein